MQCQVCGQENAAAEKICWKCGAMLASQQADRADSGTNSVSYTHLTLPTNREV